MFSSPPPYALPSFTPQPRSCWFWYSVHCNCRRTTDKGIHSTCALFAVRKSAGGGLRPRKWQQEPNKWQAEPGTDTRRSGQTPLRSRYLGQGVKGVQARRASQMKKDGPAQGQRPSPRRHRKRKRKSERKRQKHREWEAELISFAD